MKGHILELLYLRLPSCTFQHIDKVSPILQNALKIIQYIPSNVALVAIRYDLNISDCIGKEISQPHSTVLAVPPGSIRMPGEAGNSHNASLSHKIVRYLSKPEERNRRIHTRQ